MASSGNAAVPPAPLMLWLIGAAGAAAGASTVALALTSDHVPEPGLQALLGTWITLPYIAGGLVAWARRPGRRFGPLLIGAGFVSWLGLLQWSDAAVLATAGHLFDLLPAVLFLHVFLAFPSGRLGRRPERLLVVLGYTAAVGLQVLKTLLGAVPGHPLALGTSAAAGAAVERVQLHALSAVAVTGVVLLMVRRHGRGRSARRTAPLVIDAFGLALLMLAVLYTAAALGWPGFEALRLATFAVLGLAPLAFLIGLLDSRLQRAGVGDLLVRLQGDPAPDLGGLLARTLHDPSLTLLYWLPQFGSWADEDGRAATLPGPEERRGKVLIERDGEPVAALLFHPSLEDERELLDAVRAAAAIALENGRLQAELKARLQELHGSRTRVLEEGRRERRRLERDLHDGAQQRLVALSLELALLGDSLRGDDAARARVEHARAEVAVSLAELRDLAHGLYPAVLSDHGLAVAVESLAARGAVPVRLTVAVPGRLPEPVEVAAYYVVCESLANAGKHAAARTVTVDLSRAGGDLVVEVADDGVGGADTERGTGLRGLADRVEALGGRLRVWTPRGGGTRVRAEIPCG